MRVTAEFVSKHQAVYVVFAVMMVVMMVVFISNDYDDEHRITLLFRFREITVSPRTSAKKNPKQPTLKQITKSSSQDTRQNSNNLYIITVPT